MKILVTGGGGFIGSHTCLALLEKGYELVVADSFISSSIKSLERVSEILKTNKKLNKENLQIKNLDIRNKNDLNNLFLEYQKLGDPIIAVFHFAGLKSVKESMQKPLLYWDVNVNGTINLLDVMDKYNCRTIVFSSSATIYGKSNDLPFKETSEIKPVTTYGQTKAAIERLLNDIYSSNPDKWRIVNLRYFNPIGAHDSGLIGESPAGLPNNIFPYITQVAIGTLEKLTIFGNDWSTKDGTGVRDYIHIMDLAEGHIASFKYLLDNSPQLINFNLGTGCGTSVLELINTFELVNKVRIPYEISSRRNGDVSTILSDNSLALSCLDWVPKRSLEIMCSDGWKWQLLNPKGYF